MSLPASATLTLDLPLAADPNEVRRPCPVSTPPPPSDPTARRVVSIHWTPFTPRIPATAGLAAPCRWATLYGARPVQAMTNILERLDLRPWDIHVRVNPAGELLVYMADPAEPLAIVTQGLSAEEARAALDQLRVARLSGRRA